MAKYALDIFSVLRMLDKGDMNIHESLIQPDAVKELEKAAGWMLPQWMSASQNEGDHRELVKRMVEINTVWEATGGHPVLQLRLLAAAGTGNTTRHKFYKNTATKYGKGILGLLCLIMPDISPDEIDMWVRNNTEENVEELARLCGYQEKEIKPILTEFRRAKKWR